MVPASSPGSGVGLEIEEDLVLQEREWRTARIMWVVMAAIVVATLAGVFGHGGPLAGGGARDGALQVSFPRAARYGATTEMRVEATATEEVVLAGDLLADYRLETVTPQPREVVATAEHLVLRFALAAPDSPLRVSLSLLPTARGLARGSVATADGARVEVGQFVYP